VPSEESIGLIHFSAGSMEQGNIHPRILDGIRLFQERKQQQKSQQQWLSKFTAYNVDRQSVQCLVDFQSGDTHDIAGLELHFFSLAQPSDGGLNVLCDFFARSDTTLTKVSLQHCDFGSQQDASQLLAAFETNTTVTDIEIERICHLEYAALGNSLSGLMQNMPQLQRLSCSCTINLCMEGVRALQPGLRNNQTLKELNLFYCRIGDEGIRLIADALVGNTIIEVLDISSNYLSSKSLPNITRIIETTHLRKIMLANDDGVFDDNAATLNFAHSLSRNQFLTLLRIFISSITSSTSRMIFQALESNTVLEEMHLGQFSNHQQCMAHLADSLPRMKGLKRLHLCWPLRPIQNEFLPALHKNTSLEEFPGPNTTKFPENGVLVMAINIILTRNRDMHRADLLLALQPRTGRPVASKSGIWCMTMAKIVGSGNDDSNGEDSRAVGYPGASAVFKILQKRTAILEKQLRRPAAAAAASAVAASHTATSQHGGSTTRPARQHNSLAYSGGIATVPTNSEEAGMRKRQRLL
jgi:Leucine Rich repeat